VPVEKLENNDGNVTLFILAPVHSTTNFVDYIDEPDQSNALAVEVLDVYLDEYIWQLNMLATQGN
jgi:hypothetical protein